MGLPFLAQGSRSVTITSTCSGYSGESRALGTSSRDKHDTRNQPGRTEDISATVSLAANKVVYAKMTLVLYFTIAPTQVQAASQYKNLLPASQMHPSKTPSAMERERKQSKKEAPTRHKGRARSDVPEQQPNQVSSHQCTAFPARHQIFPPRTEPTNNNNTDTNNNDSWRFPASCFEGIGIHATSLMHPHL